MIVEGNDPTTELRGPGGAEQTTTIYKPEILVLPNMSYQSNKHAHGGY